MATYTVSRKTWLRGIGSDDSRLLRPDGMRCCLGFVGAQCGIPDSKLLNHFNPYGVPVGMREKFPAWLLADEWSLSDTCFQAIETNDNENLTGSERESRLQAIFAAHGDEIIFTD